MSLGAKVKDFLHSGDSKDAPHPPGSFPTEEMAPSENREGISAGHEHNKLHKPNDPRGWTEGENATRSHAYKDSGVGLTQSTDPTSYKPSQDPVAERRDDHVNQHDETLGRRNEPLGRDEEHLERRGDPTERATEPTAASRLGDNTNLTSREDTTGSSASSTQANPYWGDLPANKGVGVHNTVIGHGSPEDEAQRHRVIHHGATEPTQTSAPHQSGVFSTTSTTTDPYDAQQRAQEHSREMTSGSHFNQGAFGAGATGAAALGAHELNRQSDVGQTAAKADQTTATGQPEEHKGRSFPLLGHEDHKDKDSHHGKGVKEEKHAKEPKKEHESKLGALFHRHTSKDENYPKAEQEPVGEKHQRSKVAPASAAAAVGGATYAATRDRHGDNTQRDAATTSKHDDPAATRGTPQQHYDAGYNSTQFSTTQSSQPITGSTHQPHQQDNHHRGAGLTTGAAAGLGAGALASHDDRASLDDRSGLESNRCYDAQRSQPTHYSHKDPAAQTSPQQDSHRGAGFAAGTAAGLGAGTLASRSGGDHQSEPRQYSGFSSDKQYEPQTGAFASHEMNQRHGNDQYTADKSTRGLQPGTTETGGDLSSASASAPGNFKNELITDSLNQTAEGANAGQYGTLASGLPSGYGGSENEPFTGSHNRSQRSTESGHHHTLKENANAGKYNTLASGTPSGVRYDEELKDSPSQKGGINEPQNKDHHDGIKAAGLGAAAAGASTAAALSRDRDEKPLEREEDPVRQIESQTDRQLDRQTETQTPIAGVASKLSNSKPILHKCQKCGEDNDISEYFTSDTSGKI